MYVKVYLHDEQGEEGIDEIHSDNGLPVYFDIASSGALLVYKTIATKDEVDRRIIRAYAPGVWFVAEEKPKE